MSQKRDEQMIHWTQMAEGLIHWKEFGRKNLWKKWKVEKRKHWKVGSWEQVVELKEWVEWLSFGC